MATYSYPQYRSPATMITDTENRFNFYPTSLLQSKDIVGSAYDMEFVQEDLWSQPSEGSVEHYAESPDMNHGPDLRSAFWHYQSPLEFKLDILQAEAMDSHDENALLYGFQDRATNGSTPCMRKSDDLLAGANLSANVAPSLVYEKAGTVQPGMSWNCNASDQAAKEALRVTTPPRSAAAPHVGCQSQMRASPAGSRAIGTSRVDKTRDVCAARSAGTGRRRRASGAEEKPPPRERLTLEQKRRNHIRHETKRRGLIKDGFDCLVDTVPELRGRQWPKSTILSRTAEFLQRVQQGNMRLQQQIAELSRVKDGARL